MISHNFKGQHIPECGNSTGHLRKEPRSFESKLQEEQEEPALFRLWRHIHVTWILMQVIRLKTPNQSRTDGRTSAVVFHYSVARGWPVSGASQTLTSGRRCVCLMKCFAGNLLSSSAHDRALIPRFLKQQHLLREACFQTVLLLRGLFHTGQVHSYSSLGKSHTHTPPTD